MGITIREKHSRILRWMHWLNVPMLFFMIWSGILIYWADDAFIKIPDSLADRLKISYRLAEGMGWHFFIMWPFVINGLCYFFYLIFSGEWKERFPRKETFREAFQVLLYELKLSKKEPLKKGKYNAAQRIAYTSVLLLGTGSITSGIAIYKPVQAGELTELFGGYQASRLVHFICMSGFVFFIIIHLVQVFRYGWNNMRTMIAGYEIERQWYWSGGIKTPID